MGKVEREEGMGNRKYMEGGCCVDLSKCGQVQVLCCHFMFHFSGTMLAFLCENKNQCLCLNPWAICDLHKGLEVICAKTFQYDPRALSLSRWALNSPCCFNTKAVSITWYTEVFFLPLTLLFSVRSLKIRL